MTVLQLLNESGMKIPKGTKAAKILHHRDLDGLFSAIVAYNQLLKQGIPAKNITFKGVQYGEDKLINKYLNKSGKQATVLVDFARLNPKSQKPDFWSDHHEMPDGYVKGEKEDKRRKKIDKEYKTELLKKKKEFIDKLKKEGKQFSSSGGASIGSDFKSDTEHLATLHTNNLIDSSTLKAITTVDSAGYKNIKDTFLIRKDFKEKNRMERLAILLNALLSEKGYFSGGNEALISHLIKNSSPSLVSVYNTLIKQIRLPDLIKEGLKELNKPNPDWNKVEEIRKMLPTKELKNKVQAGRIKKRENPEIKRKTDKERFKKERKDIGKKIVNTMKNKELVKKYYNEETILEDVLEDEKNVKKYKEFLKNPKKFKENIKKRLEEIDKETNRSPTKAIPYAKELRELKNDLKITPEFAKEEIKRLANKDYENIRIKRVKSLIKHTKGYGDDETSKFVNKNGITYAPSGTQRYLWALLHKKGLKSPFVIKKFGSMVQISVNPALEDEIKNKIDLNIMAKDILNEIKKELKKEDNWAFDIIQKESGGHKGITNITNLHLLNRIDKKTSERKKYLKGFEYRLKDLKNYGSSRGRKLSSEDREKLRRYKSILKNLLNASDLAPKEQKILKDGLKAIEKNIEDRTDNDRIKIKEYYDWIKYNYRTKSNKKMNDHDKKIKEYTDKIKTIEATFENLFPDKKKELEDIEKIEKEKGSKIKNKIVKMFEEKLQEIIKKEGIKIKGEDERFKIKESILNKIR